VLDTSSITSKKLADFNSLLKKFKPYIIVAYANSIYLFAQFLKQTGSTDHHKPHAIITSAEFLDPQRREIIENVFECKVFDRYGSRETSIIASECEKHSGLHICAEALHLEFIKDSKPASPGQLGKVIVTDLLNYGMPFIRYQIEDIGASQTDLCSCGRNLPLMKMAAGRVTDFLVTPDGKIISGASLTIYLIANAPGVAQAQLIQEKKDELILKIVRDDKFGDESMRFFEKEIPEFFGKSVKYTVEFVDEIPPESSGKYRFSISKVDPSEMF
jgi:phenylacetate-CoA ligase